jgi:hypothetical protein
LSFAVQALDDDTLEDEGMLLDDEEEFLLEDEGMLLEDD